MQYIYPIRTYNEELDKIIGSFYPGELTLICGESIFGDQPVELLYSLVRMITFGTGLQGLLYTNYSASYNIYDRFNYSFTCTQYGRNYEIEKNEELVKNITKQIYDLPLIIRYSPSCYDIHKLCNEVRDFYKYKGIRIFYWAGFLPFLTEDDQILKEDAKEAFLVIQELKRLAQELAIPIIVTYPEKGTDIITGEWGIEILNVANILLDLDKSQCNSTYSFSQTPMNVLKTNDGQLGRFFLIHYFDIIHFSYESNKNQLD